MKKILFSLFFFSIMLVGAQAQKKASCNQPCTKSSAATAACHAKAPSVATTSGTDYNAAAAKLASMDATIETRTDVATGSVSYVRKETCSHSGKVSLVDVSYDASTNTFVNVSPMKMEGTSTGAGCTKATSASGKSCCAAGAASGKTCCAGKAASVKTAEKVKT